MKVLIFAEVYFPDVMGGGEFSTKQMTEGLVKKGHEVVVYCLGQNSCEEVINGVIIKREYIKGISEFYLSATKNNSVKNPLTSFDKLIRKWPDLYSSPKWYKKYKTIISKETPDLVHTVSPMSYLGRVNLWKAAYDLNIPVSHVCRSPTLLEVNFLGGKLNRYNIHRSVRACSYLTALAAPSKFMLGLHNNVNIKGQKFNEVIYNSVDFKKLPLSAEQIEQKENMVLYAGRLTEEKGILTLVKAVNELEGVRLLLIGRGELAERIKKENKVEVVDWMDRETLYTYMKKAKAVILPAEWDEAFGRILIEAIYNGTIGIGSDRGGIPEVLGFDEKYIFHAGDADGLCKRIERVISMSPIEYKEEIDRQQNMTSGFTDDKYAANWEKFFLQQLR
ncbi:MAG: glycosyltransferase [Treponema sp.]|nr:glycosyltransferase [Treponema sp.]